MIGYVEFGFLSIAKHADYGPSRTLSRERVVTVEPSRPIGLAGDVLADLTAEVAACHPPPRGLEGTQDRVPDRERGSAPAPKPPRPRSRGSRAERGAWTNAASRLDRARLRSVDGRRRFTRTQRPAWAGFIGGLHLTGGIFEPIIKPTVDAFVAAEVGRVLPAHCTGWKARPPARTCAPERVRATAVGTVITF